jgi:Leucine-rich repeat (LRR) protein
MLLDFRSFVCSGDFELSFCRRFPCNSKWFNFTVSDPSKHKLKTDGVDENSERHLGMTSVHLEFAPFNHIFAGIGETFKNLEELYVTYQQIKFVERANFEHLENLKKLWLNNNQIENLPEDVFWDLKNLEYLHLQNNKIEHLPDKIFMNLKNIIIIDVASNRIKHFPSNLLVENLELFIFCTDNNPGNTSNIDISRKPNVQFSLYLIFSRLYFYQDQ